MSFHLPRHRRLPLKELYVSRLNSVHEEDGTICDLHGGTVPVIPRYRIDRFRLIIATTQPYSCGQQGSIAEKGESTPMIGKTLGHYKVTERIGAGGRGVVCKACDSTWTDSSR